MLEPIQGHQVVCSAFIEKDGKILIVLCPKFLLWRVPGGRPEEGEKIEDTLIREMQEETGVIFENPKFIGWGQDREFQVVKKYKTSRLIMYFHVKTSVDLHMDPDECLEYKWVTLEELKKLENKEGALTDFFQRNPGFSL